jgi:ACDE family multidrug resistance protein
VAIFERILGDDADLIRDEQFQLLLLANSLAPLGTALLSPILDSLVEPFGASPASIGLLVSMFTIPAIVAIPAAGVIADRYGRHPVLVFGLLTFGAAGSAIALTTDFRIALFLRLLQGVGFSALVPTIIASIGDLYTGSAEVTGQGLRFTGSGVVQMIFPLVAGLLVGFAWQYPFLLQGIAFPIAIAVYLWFEESVPSQAGGSGGRDSVGSQLADLWELIRQRRAAAMIVARGAPDIVWIGFLTYNSILVVRVLGGTPAQAGGLAALGSLSFAVSATQAGRIKDYFASSVHPLLAMNVALGAGVAVVFLATSLPVAAIGIVVSGTGFGVVLSLYRSMLTDLAPPSLRGGLVSLAEATGRVAATLTPIGMGTGLAVWTPQIGFDASVRLVGAGAGIIAGIIGVGCLLVFRVAPPVSDPTGDGEPADASS